MTPRLPDPSQPDTCGACGQDRPLWRIYGHDDLDHVHRCAACAQAAFATAAAAEAEGHPPGGESSDLPPSPWGWARVDPGVLERRRHPVSDWEDDHTARADAGPQGWGLLAADGTPVLLHDLGWGTVGLGPDGGFRPDHPIAQALARAGEHERRIAFLEDQLVCTRDHLHAATMTDDQDAVDAAAALHSAVSGDLSTQVTVLRAALARAQADRDAARASLAVAEESVARQKSLLDEAMTMIQESRRWARDLWRGSTTPEAEVRAYPDAEIAPAWLTEGGPRP